MAKTVADVMKMVKDNEVKFVDFRFTDTRGKEQHVSVPVSAFDEDKFTSGHAFDGSSIAGWKGIEASDMLLMPDPNTWDAAHAATRGSEVMAGGKGAGFENRHQTDVLGRSSAQQFLQFTVQT